LINFENIPIALFAYKRPDHLIKTLDGLKRNNVPIIYAFIDGPKNDSEIEAINEVYNIINSINWTTTKIFKSETNLGLGKSIRKGISRVFEEYDKIIVIEDDIIMRPNAYEYTVNALNHYENNTDIMTVSMWSDPFISGNQKNNGFFSERFVCWGWGTYKKYWQTYNKSPLELFTESQNKNIDLLKWGIDIKYQALESEKRNLWYVGYLIQHFLNNKISYFPKETLVINIGKDGSGENENTIIQNDDLLLIETPIKIPNSWPLPKVDKNTSVKFARFFEHKTGNLVKYYFKKTIRKLSKLFN